MSRREFQFVSGGSSKFWAIEMKGTAFDVTFGKIGTPGTTQTKSFADAAAATKAYDKLVAEKTAKGYVEVGGGSAPTKGAKKGTAAPAAGAAKAGKAAAVAPLNELYFNITKSPDDFEKLTTFIGQKVAKFKSAKSIKKGAAKVVYKLGVSFDGDDDEDDVNGFADLLDMFLESDAPLTAEGLVIGNWSIEGPESADPIIAKLVAAKDRFPELRAIFFGDIFQEECEIS